MKPHEQKVLKKVIREVETHGLLLQADSDYPSVVTLIVGEPLKGSWWGHPLGNLIFNVCCAIDDHPDVLTVKLIKGKVTFVHRKLWEPLLAVATSRAEWQMSGLEKGSRVLLEKVDCEGQIRLDAIKSKDGPKYNSKMAGELESRLLILTQQIHTESGAHARVLISWKEWMRECSFDDVTMTASEGTKTLESTLKMTAVRPRPRKVFAWQ